MTTGTRPWRIEGYPGLAWTYPADERPLHRLTDPACPCRVLVRREQCEHHAGIVVIFDHNRLTAED